MRKRKLISILLTILLLAGTVQAGEITDYCDCHDGSWVLDSSEHCTHIGTTPMTYAFQNSTVRQSYEHFFHEALHLWGNSVEMEETSSSPIGIISEINNVSSQELIYSSITSETTSPYHIISWIIYINTALTSTADHDDLVYALAHEIGHIHGLLDAESGDVSQIMHEDSSFENHSHVTEGDINGIAICTDNHTHTNFYYVPIDDPTYCSRKICKECGAYKLVIHNYSPATCDSPSSCQYCGDSIGTATGHYLSVAESGNPTCRSYGYEVLDCINSGCTYSILNITSDALDHIESGENAYVIQAATCIQQGYRMVYCVLCDKLLDEDRIILIDSNNHTDMQSLTCTQDEKCLDCNIVFQLAQGHQYTDCTDDDCGVCLFTQTVVPISHIYSDCLDTTCNNTWDDGLGNTINCPVTRTAPGHTYIFDQSVYIGNSQICYEDWYGCSLCQTVYIDDIPHTLGIGSWEYKFEETLCKIYTEYCSNYDCSYTIVTSYMSHDWTNACDSICNDTSCNYERTPSPHTYNTGTWIPTSLEGECGNTRYTCTVCNIYYDVPDITHNMLSPVWYITGTEIECRYNITTCADCGYEEISTVYAHNFDSSTWVPIGTPSECGKYVRTCQDCDYIEEIYDYTHSYTNSCDTTCNETNCGYIRIITHSPVNPIWYDAGTETVCCEEISTCSVCGLSIVTDQDTTHAWTNLCDTDCNDCTYTRSITHIYTNSCDTTCNVCGATRSITHSWNSGTWIPVGLSGICQKFVKTCTVCGATTTTEWDYSHSWTNTCDSSCNDCGFSRSITHVYTNSCDTTCNVCGITRSITHTYTNSCDTTCNICGAIRPITHSFSGGTWDPVGTAGVCREYVQACSVCGYYAVTSYDTTHSWTNSCDTSCNECSYTRSITHTYTNSCDTTCNVCGATRTITHTWNSGTWVDVCTEYICRKWVLTCTVCWATSTQSYDYTHNYPGGDPWMGCTDCGYMPY